MSKILTILLLTLFTIGTLACSQGQLKIAGICTSISYIPGCVQYSGSGSCDLCQYGYENFDGKCQYMQKPATQCCILTDNAGACTQCAPGLYLKGNSCLKIQRPGCIQGGKGLQCINCAREYKNIQGRCFRKINSCQNFDEKGMCIECQNGFQIIRGFCSAVITTQKTQNCRLSNQYGCTVCQFGFYLTKQRICKINKKGCLKHYRQTCQLCSPQYKLVNGKCMMEGCTEFNNNGCSQCSEPYSLNQGKCIIDNCLESLDGKCLVCSTDYRIKNGRCVKPIADRCNTCANGYFVGQDGRCYKNVIGCLSYNNDGKCSKCVQPFIAIGGSCLILGCERMDSNGCKSCILPFQINSGKCQLPNCQQHNYQSRRCKSCKFGYHIQKGICVNNHELCSSYYLQNQDQICVRCVSDDYILNQNALCQMRKPGCVYQYGKCISCSSPFKRNKDSTCIIQGCFEYNINECVKCKLPYKSNLGGCVILNCDEILDGKCTRCSSGFHMISNGGCSEDDTKCAAYFGENCQKCIDGFKLNNQGICVKAISFCKIQDYNQCTQCNSGYRLFNGNCLIIDQYCLSFNEKLQGCVKCMNNYHTESGACQLNNPSCALYGQSGYLQKCIKCTEGFVMSSGSLACIKQMPGCNYDNNGLCVSCRAPFVFTGKSCAIFGCLKYSDSGCYQCQYPAQRNGDKCVIPFCDVYEQASTTCQKCFAGYKMIQGKCYREDPKCIQYTKAGQCIKCINQYTIFEGICVKKDQYCSVYSKQGGCNKCKDKYYLSLDYVCLPEQPGCIYQAGKCAYCNYPFKFNEQSLKCRIEGCLEAQSHGCTKCKYPFVVNNGICDILNCVSVHDNHCTRCSTGYHLKQGLTCLKDDQNCLKYNEDGDCQLCDKGFLLMSSGECQLAQDNCIEKGKDKQKCLVCKTQFFLNKFYQCEKKDKYCEQYNNGICVNCAKRFFLYEGICFPYSQGCVSYVGKDCTKCKSSYILKNGQCFNLKKPSLQLQGQDEKYDFDITPVDITKSKYYIDNLSPVSKLGKIFYSSFFSQQYTDGRLTNEEQNLFPKGWKAENARPGQYIGYIITQSQPVTFYAIQIQGIEGNYIKQFYIEYSIDNINFIRISKSFDSENSGKNLTTIYFTGLYAKSIRIVVKSFYGWPATRIQFFYYDMIRFRKISSLKSLKYLKEAIESNFVDRMDNQMYINQRAFFSPAKCQDKSLCFTGLELCQQRTINFLKISATQGQLRQVYLTYSIDGRNFNCFENCRHFILNQKQSQNQFILNGLLAKNLRVYPVEWSGTPNIKIAYDYS